MSRTDQFQLFCSNCASPGTPYSNNQLIARCWFEDISANNKAIQQSGSNLQLASFNGNDQSFFYDILAVV
jgi:hypothetical protein